MISSFWSNLKFELTSRKRLIAPYLYALLMLVLMFFMVIASGGAFKGVNVNFGLGQKIFVNSPFAINLYYSLLLLFGVLIISPVFGQSVCKDYEAKFDQIVHSTPTQRTGFYLGRFVGAVVVCVLIFSGLAFGHFFASKMPFVQTSQFSTFRLSAYLLPYLTLVIPNIIIFGSISFAVGAISKRMSAVYIASILCFMAYLFGSGLSGDIEQKTMRALVDPFGLNAIGTLTEYWSVADKNGRLVQLSGVFLLNRVLWLLVSLGFLTIALFYAQRSPKLKKDKKKKGREEHIPASSTVHALTSMPNSQLIFSSQARWKLFWSQVWFEAKGSLKNIYFLCLTLAGVIYMFMLSGQAGKIFGTETFPITYKVLEVSSGSFALFMMIIMSFYTGELLWRDRQSRLNQIIDAMPVPLWISSLAKFVALQVIVAFLLLIVALCGMINQAARGYFNFELGQVFTTLYSLQFVNYLIMSAMIFVLQTLANNKIVGHGLTVIFFILNIFLPSMGLDHLLYRYGASTGSAVYSDMNGYGPFLLRVRLLQLYWGLGAGILLTLVYLFWMRGTDNAWAFRLREAKKRFTTPLRSILMLLVLGFLAQGSYLYYNTNILNPYKSEKQQEKDRLHYETSYKEKYDQKPQLMIVKTNATVDLFPKTLRLKASTLYTFENKTKEPIDEMFVNLPVEKKYLTLSFDRSAKLEIDDTQIDVQTYRINPPVQPGETMSVTYTIDYGYEGIRNGATPTALAGNGTFINNSSYFPTFGYSEQAELSTDKMREQYGLKPKPRMHAITDEKARQWNYLTGHDADWIDFETTVSTDVDQIAIAPGYLQKDWIEGDRRYFHYKMDEKILNFYSFLSARYEVKRDQWNDVKLEIYYNKGHEYNLDTMMEASKQGLAYFSENFGPYQSKQFRILEFPRYQTFAQSFPNTIPFSEAIGFIAKVDPKNPKDLDYPYYVTAHELAHQWWGHQVVSADVQGATLLSETLAQYSALMVMEKKYGRDKMERFLREEMDNYLGARSSEQKIEQPLTLNENQQYIHYNKGSVVMFALKEEIGEKVLNAAIRKFADKTRYQQPPYTTSLEFVATLKENIDGKFHSLIDDMLVKITLYDNRIEKHTVTQEADGSFKIELGILGRKLYVDDKGDENETPMNQEFEISFRDKEGAVLFAQRYPLVSGSNTITIATKIKPATVHLDGLGVWIDKNREDNKLTL